MSFSGASGGHSATCTFFIVCGRNDVQTNGGDFFERHLGRRHTANLLSIWETQERSVLTRHTWENLAPQQKRDENPALGQCWTTVFDASPALTRQWNNVFNPDLSGTISTWKPPPPPPPPSSQSHLPRRIEWNKNISVYIIRPYRLMAASAESHLMPVWTWDRHDKLTSFFASSYSQQIFTASFTSVCLINNT